MEHVILPVLPHNCYLLMDNALIHKDDHLAQILIQKKITLVKLPPYFYDLNPIEMVFRPTRHSPSDTRILTTRLLVFCQHSVIFQPWPFKTSTDALGGYSVR